MIPGVFLFVWLFVCVFVVFRYFMTATLAPRMNVDNGFKVCKHLTLIDPYLSPYLSYSNALPYSIHFLFPSFVTCYLIITYQGVQVQR